MSETTSHPTTNRSIVIKRFLQQYLPITVWLPHYRRSWLRFDLIAGVTVWGTVVPTSMGFAQLAGLPAQAGLYASLVGLASYALLGTSRQLKVAASSSMAVMSAAIVTPLAAGDVSRFLALSATLALIVGIMMVLSGMARMGFIADFLAKPVVNGFIFGLAVTIAIKMAPRLFGLESSDGSAVQQFWQLMLNLPYINWWTLAISAAAFGLIFLLRHYFPQLPGALIILLLGILAVILFDLGQHEVSVVGAIPQGLPTLQLPIFGAIDFLVLLVGAGGVLFVALAESVGSARTFADEHRYEIDPDQELIALGVANLGAGLLQGFAVAANLPATSTAKTVTSRTQLASLISAMLIAFSLAGPGLLFRFLPNAVLAVAVIVAVVPLMNVAELRRLYHSRKIDFALAFIALCGVLISGVLVGLLLAVFLSLAIVLYQASQPQVAVLGKVAGHVAYVEVERNPLVEQVPGLLIIRPDVQLFFANANMTRSRIKRLIFHQSDPVEAVLVDLGATSDLDVASADMLGDLLVDLGEANIELYLARVKARVYDRLYRTGFVERIGEDHFYLNVIEGVEVFLQPDKLVDNKP